MRVLLALPYDATYIQDIPDLGLGYLAACLEAEGHTVELSLRPCLFASPDHFADFVRKGDFDLYGIKVMSSSVLAANETIKIIRRVDPEATVLIGGPQVSAAPLQAFELMPEASHAFYGEAEIGLVEFVNKLAEGPLTEEDLGAITSLIWRQGTEIRTNPRRFVTDLDELPYPAWDLMEPRSFPIAPITLTRGCPNHCKFCGCTIVNGNRIRSRSIENIMGELRLLTTKHGVREIVFFDSNCAHRQGPLREVCKRIIDEGIDITWCAPVGIRLDSIDEELVGLMKRSGCFQVNVGIESGSLRILEMMRKSVTPDLAREKVKLLRAGGIEVVGLFMIGFPGETAEEIQQTVSLAMELPLTGASFSILCPLPGTDIYDEVYGDRAMGIEDLDSLDFINYRNTLSEVSAEELREIQKRAYLKFHLRPHVIKCFLRNLNSLDKIRFLASKIYRNAFKG
jgi:radical SAM superfamily enzyme YgiQ (UPF0313 family)